MFQTIHVVYEEYLGNFTPVWRVEHVIAAAECIVKSDSVYKLDYDDELMCVE